MNFKPGSYYAGYGDWILIVLADGPVLVGPEIGLEVDEDATGLRSGSPIPFLHAFGNWSCSFLN